MGKIPLGLLAALVFCTTNLPSWAHHGVASLGAVGLEGPGAPLETSSSATLPQGKWLSYLKIDHAQFQKFTLPQDDEADFNRFQLLGLGYGVLPWLSTYFFVPYNIKTTENGSFNTQGLADLSANIVVGFKFDEGFKLIPSKESLDELEDFHSTIYFSSSIPTGNPYIKNPEGQIDPGKSLGFGAPAMTIGFTGTKMFASILTAVGELSFLKFLPFRYTDGVERQFGNEGRVNAALCYRAFVLTDSKFRLDANLEFNFLFLDRDRESAVGKNSTGGEVLYLVPGIRAYYRSFSAGLGLKVPFWSRLNERVGQQGSEGTENYRLLLSLSALL